MKYCRHCGKELLDEAVICFGCGCATGVPNTILQQQEDDPINIGLCILSALIPLFGFIYWPLTYKTRPRTARACGIVAIAAFALYWVICILYLFC